MNERNKISYMKEWIQRTMNVVELDVDVKHEQNGINMTYNFIYNYVGFDAERVEEAVQELPINVPLNVYITTFTLHELGHAIDRKALLDSLPVLIEIFEMKEKYSVEEQYSNSHLIEMLIEEHKMNIASEEVAWKNAEILNSKYHLVETDVFDKLKAHSLATYTDLYEEDLQAYNELVNMQIA